MIKMLRRLLFEKQSQGKLLRWRREQKYLQQAFQTVILDINDYRLSIYLYLHDFIICFYQLQNKRIATSL